MTIESWLQTLHSDGVNVSSQELMYYRSKVSAFSRVHRLQRSQSMNGHLLSKLKGRGMEFDEYRIYQAGDDIRAIDWRVTARTGTPHTKLFREERERPVLLVVDLSASLQFGSQLLFKSVQACHLASALAWLAQARNDRVGCLVAAPEKHLEVRPQARSHGVLRIINSLTEVQQHHVNQTASTSSSLLNGLLERAQQVAKPGTLIYVISDWLQTDAQTLKHCLALGRHSHLVPFQVIDPLECVLPTMSNQQLAITNGHRNININPGTPEHRTQFQQAAQARDRHLTDMLEQAGLSIRRFSAGVALEQQWPGQAL